MKLGTKIIIVGFILFAVGVMVIEVTAQNLSHEPRKSDIPLWISMTDDMPTYLIIVGIIATIVGFIIRMKQYHSGLRYMKK